MEKGVFFAGMEVPKSCAVCPVVKRFGGYPFQRYSCGARPDLPDVYSAQASAGRPDGCPAREMAFGVDMAEGDSVSVCYEAEGVPYEFD